MLTNALPTPTAEEQAHSQRLMEVIAARCPLSFADYMQAALYEPGFGYYSAGKQKFGVAGDYVTAPMISPLFTHCVTRQIVEVLAQISGNILELGAGNGVFALECLRELARLKQLPTHYFILELSADLRAQQQMLLKQALPDYFPRIRWLNTLPTDFHGVIVANEVLDAMPVHRFYVADKLYEYQVIATTPGFAWRKIPATTELAKAISALDLMLPADYCSEINLFLKPWLASLADCLTAGAILLIDYGFPRHEYYHPDRNQGTLMCHYRHRAHANPLILTGLQDITAHVDFTAVADAGLQHGLTLAGYTSQAHFLLACGLLDELQKLTVDTKTHYNLANAVKLLTLPSEMGELFKVIALTKGSLAPLLGFSQHNMQDKLYVTPNHH